MDITGIWFNPIYAGEGFIFREKGGKVIGYYFTYDNDGSQAWYLFVGNRTGDTVAGNVLKTRDGGLAAPTNPQTVVETKVGTFTLVFDETWEFDATISGSQVGYRLYSLFGTDPVISPPPAPEPEPEPEPEPQPDNPFEGKLTFRFKPFKHPSWLNGEFELRDGQWYVLWGTPQISYDQLRSGSNVMYEIEITGLQPITLTHSAHGWGSPSIARTTNGTKITYVLKLTRGNRPNGHDYAHYQINVDGTDAVVISNRILGGQ